MIKKIIKKFKHFIFSDVNMMQVIMIAKILTSAFIAADIIM